MQLRIESQPDALKRAHAQTLSREMLRIRRFDEAIAFAEAGEWEPIEDLLKDVYTTSR